MLIFISSPFLSYILFLLESIHLFFQLVLIFNICCSYSPHYFQPNHPQTNLLYILSTFFYSFNHYLYQGDFCNHSIFIYQAKSRMKQAIEQIQESSSKVMQVDNRTYVQVQRQGQARKKVIIELLINSKNFISKHIQIRMQRDQLDHQFQIQSSISSPYIIKPFNMFIESKKIVWISEHFHCFLNQLPISHLNFEQRFLIFYDIAHGVKELSRHLICHRSLSPNSISIIKNQSGRFAAKINNFSTATSFKAEKDLSEQGIQEINPFSAPELVSKSANGLPVDIWSLGCLLNYLLYEGLQNIKRTTKQAVVVQVPESTPSWLQDLLSSMINIQPNKRAKIKAVIELIKPMYKCKEVLSKYVPVGRGVFQIKRQGN